MKKNVRVISKILRQKIVWSLAHLIFVENSRGKRSILTRHLQNLSIYLELLNLLMQWDMLPKHLQSLTTETTDLSDHVHHCLSQSSDLSTVKKWV